MVLPINILESTRKNLHVKGMFVNEEWLISCLEYVTNFIVEKNLALIHSEVENQWLLHDLTLICPGCLPQNLKSQEKTTLQGVFVLQINSVIDVGRPAYQQYLELQNVNTENVEATVTADQKVPAHRLIKLYMTDGVQDIIGMEYKPIKILNSFISPGIKARIKGPVECRRGTLLLTDKNFELMDSEVEDLLIINSQLACLQRKLGLNVTMQQPTVHNITDNIIEPKIEIIDEIEGTEKQNQGVPKRPPEDVTLPPEKKMKSQLNDHQVDNNPALFQSDNFQQYDFEDEFYEEDFKDELSTANNQLDNRAGNLIPDINKEIKVDCIKTINNFNGDKSNRTFNVKAKILTLISKLSVTKDSWNLRCTIRDESGTIDVDFTNDVLSKLVGYTPKQMYEIKKQMNSQPELHKKLEETLIRIKKELQTLHYMMEIDIKEKPTVIKLTPC